MPHVVRVDRAAPDPAAVAEAAAVLRRGGLVAFPTETVYGLGARAWDVAALRRIFAVKRRPPEHPLIAHVVDAAQARELAASWPERAARLAAAFWPGPLTLVVDRAEVVPSVLSGGGPSIAVRAPAHPIARALIAALGDPVAAPSANAYQGLSPTLAAHVTKQLGDAVDLLLDGGPCDAGIESTVVDVRGPETRVLRPGALDLASLREIAPDVVIAGGGERTVADGRRRASPGMDARHYAPRAPLELAVDWEQAIARAVALAASGARVGLVALGAPAVAGGASAAGLEAKGVILVSLPDRARDYARAIYRALHDLDDAGADAIVVQDVPRAGHASASATSVNATEAWFAVADRLARAAGRVP
jgi:L-threonylcarbamoyladenylate synthase